MANNAIDIMQATKDKLKLSIKKQISNAETQKQILMIAQERIPHIDIDIAIVDSKIHTFNSMIKNIEECDNLKDLLMCINNIDHLNNIIANYDCLLSLHTHAREDIMIMQRELDKIKNDMAEIKKPLWKKLFSCIFG